MVNYYLTTRNDWMWPGPYYKCQLTEQYPIVDTCDDVPSSEHTCSKIMEIIFL